MISASHSKSYVCALKCGSIIYAVACHSHNSFFLHSNSDKSAFVVWQRAGYYRQSRQKLFKLIIGQLFKFTACKNYVVFALDYTAVLSDAFCRVLIVAGYHYHLYSSRLQKRYCVFCFPSYRIVKSNGTNKGKLSKFIFVWHLISLGNKNNSLALRALALNKL